MLRIFSVLYWIFICLTLPVFYVGALLVYALTAWWDRRKLVLHLYTCFWGCFYVYASPIWTLSVEGRNKLPWKGRAVLIANHASLIDILVLFGLYRPYKWVSKVENFKLPFIGWNMSLNGYVPLVRGDRSSVEDMMARCRRLLNADTPVLIFPEGTRSKTGELQSFKDGAFRLALDTNSPVIPIAVEGTARALPKHGLILRDRMHARLTVLDPIDPDGYTGVEALRDAAHEALARALAEAS